MKNFLAYHVCHDSSIVAVSDGKLIASIEGEKDLKDRFYFNPTIDNAFDWMNKVSNIHEFVPDVISILGMYSTQRDDTNHYYGLDYNNIVNRKIMGKNIDFFYTTHEKAHIYLTYALSPYPQGMPVYCLVWEGGIGAVYRIDSSVRISKISDLISFVGYKYSFLFYLAGEGEPFSLNTAEKIMALASFAKEIEFSKYLPAIDYILTRDYYEIYRDKNSWDQLKADLYSRFRDMVPIDKGVTSQHFKEFAFAMQQRILDIFLDFASENMAEGLPLLISGGCGLNCYWNQKITESGLFSDVFIPPCTNDSGIAIGQAAEAQHYYTGNAKIEWSVYSGEPFNEVDVDIFGFRECPLDMDIIASFLAENDRIICWVQGRYEIGPRALCNRSLLASPFSANMLERLNLIKKRESYRPIAPVCIEEDMKILFNMDKPSPYMLHFSDVINDNIKAVTHVDNTARVQTVNKKQNPLIYELLLAFKTKTGVGVLCNTSLNFNGKGFINNTEDVFRYARERKVDGIVIGDRFYISAMDRDELPIGLSQLAKYNPEKNSLFYKSVCISKCNNDSVFFEKFPIMDWSLFDIFEIELLLTCDKFEDKIKIKLQGDYQCKIYCFDISEEIELSLNKREKIRFDIKKFHHVRERLNDVNRMRLVFISKKRIITDIEISAMSFLVYGKDKINMAEDINID
ncbi:MAG: proline dehydrogenase [Spirochaetes bacterium]|nr:proline dehydrogenase [Spirochaetota bacterium]MBN2769384.1 proline dehydrogenase [Spirochaetota bacterium]